MSDGFKSISQIVFLIILEYGLYFAESCRMKVSFFKNDPKSYVLPPIHHR